VAVRLRLSLSPLRGFPTGRREHFSVFCPHASCPPFSAVQHEADWFPNSRRGEPHFLDLLTYTLTSSFVNKGEASVQEVFPSFFFFERFIDLGCFPPPLHFRIYRAVLEGQLFLFLHPILFLTWIGDERNHPF